MDGHAFALSVAADFVIPQLQPTSVVQLPGHVRISRLEEGSVAPAQSEATERLLTRSFTNGDPMLTVDRCESGYRVCGWGHGRYFVSEHGTDVYAALPSIDAWRWQRLLFAQVLPLAAALQGLTVLHASAVAVNGRAVAFAASSGTGKTSLAAHLVAGGAVPITDDVLALELGGGGVTRAYPGPRLFGIAPAEVAAVDASHQARLGTAVGEDEKTYFESAAVDRAHELAAVYFLERRGRSGRLRIEEVIPVQPQLLLSSGFLTYLGGDHLSRLLDVCAAIAGNVPVFHVDVPTGVAAATLADAVDAHLRSVML